MKLSANGLGLDIRPRRSVDEYSVGYQEADRLYEATIVNMVRMGQKPQESIDLKSGYCKPFLLTSAYSDLQ